jgi:hypothetical protein
MLHDRPHHHLYYRRRLAAGDLFLGPYAALIPALTSKRTASINGFVHRRLGGGFRTARVERDVVPMIR